MKYFLFLVKYCCILLGIAIKDINYKPEDYDYKQERFNIEKRTLKKFKKILKRKEN